MTKKNKPLDLEELAKIEHEQWVEWSKELAMNESLSKDRVKRWRQFWIPYEKLPERAKEDDRKWARKVAQRIKSACKFYLRYRDNPELLLRNYWNDMTKEERNMANGFRSKLIEFDDNVKMKLIIKQSYNEWLFKLAFQLDEHKIAKVVRHSEKGVMK